MAHSSRRWLPKISDADPARTCSPPIEPSMPDPSDSFTAFGISRRNPRARAVETIAAATICWDACSNEAANLRTSSAFSAGAVSIATSRAPPTVSVPVLSNSTVWTRASASKGPPPLMRMPCRAARDIPAMKATGAARISGQGVDATSTARPRSASPEAIQAPPATTRVIGSRSRAYLSAIRMKGAFAVCAAVTRRTSRTVPPAYITATTTAARLALRMSAAVMEMSATVSTPVRPATRSRVIETPSAAITGTVPAAHIQLAATSRSSTKAMRPTASAASAHTIRTPRRKRPFRIMRRPPFAQPRQMGERSGAIFGSPLARSLAASAIKTVSGVLRPWARSAARDLAFPIAIVRDSPPLNRRLLPAFKGLFGRTLSLFPSASSAGEPDFTPSRRRNMDIARRKRALARDHGILKSVRAGGTSLCSSLSTIEKSDGGVRRGPAPTTMAL